MHWLTAVNKKAKTKSLHAHRFIRIIKYTERRVGKRLAPPTNTHNKGVKEEKSLAKVTMGIEGGNKRDISLGVFLAGRNPIQEIYTEHKTEATTEKKPRVSNPHSLRTLSSYHSK